MKNLAQTVSVPSTSSHAAHTPARVGFRVLAATAALSSALFLASCAEERSETSGPEVEQAIGLAVDAPRVIVHDAGEGDLRLLTYSDATAEGEQTLTLSVSDGFAQSVAPADLVDPTAPAGDDVSTMRMPVTASTSRAESNATEADQAEDEVAEVLTATRNIDIQVAQPAFSDLELAEDIRSAEGFKLGIRADDSGRQSTISLAAPVDATDISRVMMEQYLLKYTSLPVLFPEEEIGVGANWSIDSRVSGEATLLQTVTYTVTGIRGNSVDLDVSITQRPSLGAINIDDTTSGVTSDTPEQLAVLNSNTASTGSITVDLTKPMPTSGQVSWTTRVVYGGTENDNRVVQDSTSSISFES